MGNGRVIRVDMDVKTESCRSCRGGRIVSFGWEKEWTGKMGGGSVWGSDRYKIRNLGHTYRTHQGDLKVSRPCNDKRKKWIKLALIT